MIKVSCSKCGQKRKAASNKAYFVWLEHNRFILIMQKDFQTQKWKCCNGYGCDSKEK